ncbi:MAG: DUF92 domain-containing protein [Gemmatimonadaceae bacterium]|nr:DUF92 domain-containing protein [Gemmatimonadaceae bacterium]
MVSETAIARLLVGIIAAVAVAVFARRRGSLTEEGMWSAIALGSVITVAGYGWAFLLLTFFLTSIGLSEWRRTEKEEATSAILPDDIGRTGAQVLANGGVFGLCGLGWLLSHHPMWWYAGAGALAAATADTWATEIGIASRRTPVSIVGFQPIATGLSGGVTWPGTVGLVAGATLLALASSLLNPTWIHDSPWIVALAGIGGALTDSLLGATLQSVRYCDYCKEWTERFVHRCEYRTRPGRGLSWLTNNVVNAVATAVGALFGAIISLVVVPGP